MRDVLGRKLTHPTYTWIKNGLRNEQNVEIVKASILIHLENIFLLGGNSVNEGKFWSIHFEILFVSRSLRKQETNFGLIHFRIDRKNDLIHFQDIWISFLLRPKDFAQRFFYGEIFQLQLLDQSE